MIREEETGSKRERHKTLGSQRAQVSLVLRAGSSHNFDFASNIHPRLNS